MPPRHPPTYAAALRQIGCGLVDLAALAADAILAQSTAWQRATAADDELRRLVMALTQNEQQAVNDLSAALDTMAGDLDAALAAARQNRADLQAQIDKLTAGQAVDQATIAAMQATADAMETDVVGALAPLTQRVQGIDTGLKTPTADGGSSLTPDA